MKTQSAPLTIRTALGAVALLTSACTRADVTLESLLGERTDSSAVAP